MADEVKLYGMWLSPFSCRAKLALKLKGIKYEYIEEDLSNKSSPLLQYNPVYKKIPVLVHNGKPIVESLVIVEYTDETWKNSPILPSDPYDRAIARFWSKFVDDKIFAAALKASTGKDEEKKQATEELSQYLKIIEKELQGKEFFGGETYGYLDIIVFVLTYWLKIGQEVHRGLMFNPDNYPNLYKWTEKLLDIDVFSECIPPKEKHVAFMEARLGAAKSAEV